MSHTEKSEECDSCGWETDALTECSAWARTRGHGPNTPDEQKQWGWMCEVCRHTMAGNAYCYPDQYSDSAVLRTVAWGINYLADVTMKARA